MQTKKHNLGLNLLLVAVICGSFVVSTNSHAAKKKKKSSSTVTNACIACLNSFNAEKLDFTIDADKCPKRLARCFKSNQSNKCESIIQDCIQTNCASSGTCSNEIGNRSLFAGCLKAVNQVLPYQCASYIAGYASSKAQEELSKVDAQERAIEQKKLEVQKAQEDAKRAQAQAEEKAKLAQADAEVKKKQIEEDNKIKLEQEKARLEQQAKDAELARQKKAALEARNNKPNVKYNNLLNDVKQSVTSAKNFTTKAFNLLGITKTNDKQTQGSVIFFPPQIITVPAIMASTDAKTRALVNSSRYKTEQNFVCTKDTKENFVKNELNNVYNTIKKARDKLETGISEIEATNADDETTNTISESKINTLYQAQNKLTEIMETVEGYTSKLKTNCETRCEGLSTMSNSSFTVSSSPIEFDENGNIIEEKKKTEDNNAYSCKDLENEVSSKQNDMASVLGTSTGMSDMFGGVGKKVTELTKRNTEAVLYTDRLLDETLVAVQSGKFDGTSSDYPAIDSCTQYMVLDIAQYTNCASNVLGQQLTALSVNKENDRIKEELNSSIKKIIKTLQSPNYEKQLKKTILYCSGSSKTTGTSLYETSYSNLNDYDDFYTCTLSITNALNDAKKSKSETGKFNFQIATATGDTIYLTTGESLPATEFAEKKLNWDVQSCKLSITKTGETSSISFISGIGNSVVPLQTNNNSNNVNMYESRLECTCTGGARSTPNFQQINMGNVSADCSESQK